MSAEKKIVEEVSGWLRIFEDGSVDRTWTGPPEFKFMVDPVPPHEDFVDGVATRDIFVNVDSGIRVRIYLPNNDQELFDKKLPIVLHFHGGGYCISQPDWYMYYHVYTRLAQAAGVVIVSVYLPLAPEHRLPAACYDGYAAFLWLCSMARGDAHDKWLQPDKVDFNRVFLIGDSSGGNLVHQVAVRAGSNELAMLRLAGAIIIHPGFVRSERSKSELEKPQSPFFTLEMSDMFVRFALPAGSTRDHPITCPMGYPMEELKMPPVMLWVAEDDLMVDTQKEYYEAMKKAKKDVELVVNHGMGHCFYLNKVAINIDPHAAAQTEELIAGITKFISQH